MEEHHHSPTIWPFSQASDTTSHPGPIAVSWEIKVWVLIGLVVSFAGLFETQYPLRGLSIWQRVGIACAESCSLGIFVFCWSSVVAYVIRRQGLPPKSCRWAAIPLLLPGCLIGAVQLLSNTSVSYFSIFLICAGTFAEPLCRKLAFPSVSAD